MFGSYFGNYLLEQGDISAEQLADVKEAVKSVRLKLGLLAVASGLMTVEQADQVNQLQQTEDKRFGDIAVEKGYLTDEQVGDLLKKQGDPYLSFIQALTDKGIFTLDQVSARVEDFKAYTGYTDQQFEDLKSGDLDRIVPLFFTDPALSSIHKDYVSVILRSIMRFIDTDIRIDSIKKLGPHDVGKGVSQSLFGDQDLFTSFFGEDQTILEVASVFGQEDFLEVNEDSLDALGEFLNVSNGLFVSGQSEKGVELDLKPPVMYPEDKTADSDGIAYIASVYISGKKAELIFGVNTEITVK